MPDAPLRFGPSLYPDPAKVSRNTGEAVYKIHRLQEMATIWKGTVLEPHTVKLLAMLLQEDGTVTAERRHDCENGACFAIGIQGHNICHRGTPLVSQAAGKPFKKYCSNNPQKRFEEDYPGFSTDWRIQFAEYTLRQTNCINSGKSVNRCIQDWNPNEAGRIDKVKKKQGLVFAALGL